MKRDIAQCTSIYAVDSTFVWLSLQKRNSQMYFNTTTILQNGYDKATRKCAVHRRNSEIFSASHNNKNICKIHLQSYLKYFMLHEYWTTKTRRIKTGRQKRWCYDQKKFCFFLCRVCGGLLSIGFWFCFSVSVISLDFFHSFCLSFEPHVIILAVVLQTINRNLLSLKDSGNDLCKPLIVSRGHLKRSRFQHG